MDYSKDRKAEIDRQIKSLRDELAKIKEKEATDYIGDDYSSLINGALENTTSTFPTAPIVACQGVQGAYSQKAAEKLFKDPEIMYVNSFESVFRAIEQGLCEYGVLPIENNTAGSVNKIYDLMADHKFYIVRSTRVKVEHCLIGKKGAKLTQIKHIYSHPQALDQCEEYLDKLSGVEIHEVSNTAVAAKELAESGEIYEAAIGSDRCAELYDLEILDEGIQNHEINYTKFICISKIPEIYPGADKTSIMATVSHKPGSLFEVLKTFNDKGYNIYKLESRPIPATDFEFRFYFDYEASVYHSEFINTLNELDAICESLTYLGSYNEKL